MRRLRLLLTPPHLVLIGLVVIALVVRWQLVDFQSGDYRAFLDRWYAYIAENGGFAALKDSSFSNYNTPYLVLMAILTYLPIPEMVAIKAISVVFDLALATFAYKIVSTLRPSSRWLPVAGFGVVILLPTVVMNSSMWAQCDAIYVTFCLGSLYYLIKRRPWWAAALFGIAFAFKLQAVFFLPVLVVVMIINRQRIRALLAAPVTFMLCLTPALVAGRSLLSQLSVYPAQIANPSGQAAGGGGGGVRGGRGGGGLPGGGTPSVGGRGGAGFSPSTGSTLTDNAPTPYAWLPTGATDIWKYLGLATCAVVVLAFGIWLLRRRRQLSGSEILLVAAAATLVVPLLLPNMHERYFYLAEVLAVLAAFVDRRFLAVAAAIQIASISTYLSYLESAELMPLRLAALIAFFAAVGAAAILVHRLSGGRSRRTPASVGKLGRDAVLRPSEYKKESDEGPSNSTTSPDALSCERGSGAASPGPSGREREDTVSGAGQNLDHVVEPVGADPRGARGDAVAQRQT